MEAEFWYATQGGGTVYRVSKNGDTERFTAEKGWGRVGRQSEVDMRGLTPEDAALFVAKLAVKAEKAA